MLSTASLLLQPSQGEGCTAVVWGSASSSGCSTEVSPRAAGTALEPLCCLLSPPAALLLMLWSLGWDQCSPYDWKQWERLLPAPRKEGAPCQLSSVGCSAPHRDLRLWLEPSAFPHLMLSFVFLRQEELCVQIIKGKNRSD